MEAHISDSTNVSSGSGSNSNGRTSPLIKNQLLYGAATCPVSFCKFWTVKRCDERSFSSVSPIAIYRSIKAKIGEVESVAKASSGSLVIGAANKSQADRIQGVKSIAEYDVLVSANEFLNSSKGVIFCKDLMNCTIDEIKEELASQGVIDVHQVNRRTGGDETVPTGTFFLTFKGPDPPERIRVAFYRAISVRRYIPAPLRCFKCYKFGHISKRCLQQEESCVCGKPAHTGKPCTPPLKCANCEGDHTSRSVWCPEFIIEKEIQRVKAVHKLAYPEAKRLVRDNAYVMPGSSYARKAASKPSQTKLSKNIITNTEKEKETEENIKNNAQGVINKKETEQSDQNQRRRNRNRRKRPANPPTPPPPKHHATGPAVLETGNTITSLPQVEVETGATTTPQPLPPRTTERGSNTPTPQGDRLRLRTQQTIPPEEPSPNCSEEEPMEEMFKEVRRKKGWPKGKSRKDSLT